MTPDRDTAQVLQAMQAASRRPFEQMSVAEARATYRETRYTSQLPPPEVRSVRDDTLPGPAGAIPIRIYHPDNIDGTALVPGLVFLHGGGWVIGDLDTHDTICRLLAKEGGACVIAVDYRLAPEHPFPAAFEDALAAWDAVARNPVAYGIDPTRLAIGGDSAGGALAASVTIARRGARLPQLQLLFYPATDLAEESSGYMRVQAGVPLTGHTMRWFRGHYTGGLADPTDWRASPLRAPSLQNLSPALIVTAGLDPLAEEGQAYATRLAQAEVQVTHLHLSGQIHGILTMSALLRDAAMLIALAGHRLRCL